MTIPVPRSDSVGTPRGDTRLHTRFDKAFIVLIGSEVYGDTFAVARNISGGGILVEMPYAPPLGTVVTVHFQYAREAEDYDEIVARAEVKHHHYLNFSNSGDEAARARAVGLRFIEFVDTGHRVDPERVQ
jgi:hypothetical protein